MKATAFVLALLASACAVASVNKPPPTHYVSQSAHWNAWLTQGSGKVDFDLKREGGTVLNLTLDATPGDCEAIESPDGEAIIALPLRCIRST